MTDHDREHNHDDNAGLEMDLDIEQGEVHHIDIDGDGDTEPISDHDPLELAQAFVAEHYGDSGWMVEEVAGNVDFGMVTVLLGRYEGDQGSGERVETVEGHGTTIPAAIDAALRQLKT